MRAFTSIAAVLVTALACTANAQTRVPTISGLLDRVSTETSVRPVDADKAVRSGYAVPGSKVVLDLEVRPNRGIRVFAPGAKKFVPALVVLNRPKGIKPGKPAYDIPEYDKNPGDDKRVPMYKRSFNIKHTITIDKNVKPGTVIGVTGALTYQTCDERIVYPKRTLPVRWTIRVEQP
jgi:hypothetical protein